LRRLGTERIDLVQHHEIIRYEDPHRIFDDEGANAALVEARQAGKLRYIGFTGFEDTGHGGRPTSGSPCRALPRIPGARPRSRVDRVRTAEGAQGPRLARLVARERTRVSRMAWPALAMRRARLRSPSNGFVRRR
jgi:hypothetical protein